MDQEKIIEVRCLEKTEVAVYKDTIEQNAQRVEQALRLDAEHLKMLFERIAIGAPDVVDLGDDAEGHSWIVMNPDPKVVLTVGSLTRDAGTWYILPLSEGAKMMACVMGLTADSVREDFKKSRSVKFSTDLASYSLTPI